MVLLASGLILRAYRQAVTTESARQARALAERLSRPLGQAYLTYRGWDGAAEALGRRIVEDGGLEGRLLLADEAGRVVYDSQGVLLGRRVPLRLRASGAPVEVLGRQVGVIYVEPSSAQRDNADRAFVRSLAWIVTAGSAAALLVATLMALFVARRLTRPLRELTVAARRIAAGERHEPIRAPADAELAELALAFNSMAAELGRQEELRRQMVADIAHELRTPLSVLRLQVESIEDGMVPASSASVGALGGEINLLARLVDDLRLLSLADAGQLSLSIEAVDPREALAHTARSAEAGARLRGVAMRVETGPPLPAVRADPQRLIQILGNLVENALRHTPAGGAVTLAALPSEGCGPRGAVAFEVRDTGVGIPAADLPHIFERFYRVDRARARETGGSGLGLAIVQRLALAQGGKVAVESPPGQGATFRVLLPAA